MFLLVYGSVDKKTNTQYKYIYVVSIYTHTEKKFILVKVSKH